MLLFFFFFTLRNYKKVAPAALLNMKNITPPHLRIINSKSGAKVCFNPAPLVLYHFCISKPC